jgi:pimeloyl-ACP methyl ester carboxylesterase
MPVFALTHRVVAIDLAGHGASGDGRQRFTIAAFGADVAAVVGKEDLDKVVLIGHSMGGPVALEAARQLAGKVELIVGVDALENVEARFPQEAYQRLHDGMVSDFRATTEAFVRTMFPKDANPKLVADIAGDMASAPPRVGVSALEEFQAFDEAAGMDKAGVPVACINAAMFPTDAQVNRKHATSFEVVVIEGVGHFLHLEQPQAFNLTLARILYIRDLGPAPK